MASQPSSGELVSDWEVSAVDLAGSNKPCRLEGEVGNLIIRGKVPKELDGTFYRVSPYLSEC
jgi:carotenoid cleavage dioxygenase-like enzyme